jgi:chlorophyllide a hydrolase
MAIEVPVWIYWLVCMLATLLLVTNQQRIPNLLSPDLDSPQQQQGYSLALTLGWATTLLAAIGYILLTRKEAPGSYQIQDLIVFSLLNGVLEQMMFVFWFLLGCWLGSQLKIQHPWQIFSLGCLSYMVYSGAIHALFWVNVLPTHQFSDVIRPGLLVAMSLMWMWLFWRYRAVVAIIAMHIVIDFLSVGHLHFSWFEPYQWVSYILPG